jgi:hypothetical protein
MRQQRSAVFESTTRAIRPVTPHKRRPKAGALRRIDSATSIVVSTQRRVSSYRLSDEYRRIDSATRVIRPVTPHKRRPKACALRRIDSATSSVVSTQRRVSSYRLNDEYRRIDSATSIVVSTQRRVSSYRLSDEYPRSALLSPTLNERSIESTTSIGETTGRRARTQLAVTPYKRSVGQRQVPCVVSTQLSRLGQQEILSVQASERASKRACKRASERG